MGFMNLRRSGSSWTIISTSPGDCGGDRLVLRRGRLFTVKGDNGTSATEVKDSGGFEGGDPLVC